MGDILAIAKAILFKRDLDGSQDSDEHSEDCAYIHPHCLIEALANEIARLRLTNEERGAITWASAGMLEDADITANRGMAQRSQHSREAAETLKGLLERHKND